MIRNPRPFPDEPSLVPTLGTRRRLTRKQVYSLAFLCLFLLSGLIGGWSVAVNLFRSSAAGTSPSFTFQQFLQQGHAYHPVDGPHVLPNGSQALSVWNGLPQTTAQVLPSAEPPRMTTVSVPLSSTVLAAPVGGAGVPLHLAGSDGQGVRFEATLPAGALDLSQARTAQKVAPQGTLTLSLTQLRGHYAAGLNELGTFQFQITDAQSHVLQGVQLRQPMTLVFHYQPNELSNLGLDPGKMYLIWSAPSSSANATAAPTAAAGTVVPLQNDAAAGTLTAQSSMLGVTPFVVSGPTPIQNPPKANFVSVQGNSGQLSYQYPLQVAPGPKGTVPTLVATYSSEATNERRTPTSPANNVGDGWDITMGAIGATKYPDGTTWYSISGADNVSDLLIPDTTGNTFATAHISYLKISKITSGSTGQPCFNVYDTSGNFSEYGCTSDSLQYYIDSSGNRVNYLYGLDKMIPANEGSGTNGRNLTASYVQDFETSGGHTWVRDSALKQITYGNGVSRIGTIDFFYNGPFNYTNSGIQYVTQYTSTYETNCHLPTSPQGQRCDDPVDRSGGLPDPDVMSTLSLQTVKTYVGDDSSSTHLDYSYSFAYQESAFGNCPSADPTLLTAYCAGNHLLTGITPTVYQNSTGQALPGATFSYSGGRTNSYDDSSQSYHLEDSWNYLSSYHDHSTGVGASSIVYHTAYNNSHGTPGTSQDNRYDSLYCDWHATDCTSGTSYYPMDDKMWTMQVVTQITSTGKDSSASGLSSATTSYDYWLTKTQGVCPVDSAGDSDCVGFGWIPNSGTDWQDFYHGEFRGFGTALITSPAGDLTVQKYASTWGWDSPSSDPRNYLAGQLLEQDTYQGATINGATLLAQTTSTYAGQNSTQASCASTATYPSTMYRPCEVLLLSSRTTTYEKTGSGNTNAPWVQHDDTYDDYTTTGGLGDHHQSPATGSYGNLQQEVTSGSNIPTSTQHWTYYTTNTTSGGVTFYNVHIVAHTDLVDASSHMWQCQDTTYDAGVAGGVPSPAAGWPTTTSSYTDCSHQSTSAITTYYGYNTFGDQVASVDSNGAANPSLYTSAGCTLTTAPRFFPTGSWSATHYTFCSAYDSVSSLKTDSWNALMQHTSTAYDATQGQLPITVTDVNSQITGTAYSYDSSGNRTVGLKLPGESSSYTGHSTLTSTCTDSSTLPCLQIDTNTSFYSSAVTQTFYDGMGRAVETLKPGPDATHTTVAFTVYNDAAHTVFASLPFVVNSTTSWVDPNGAVDDTGATPGGTSTTLDPMGRTLSVTDALSHQSTISYGLGSANGDSGTYATATSVDANSHVQVSYLDGLSRTRYVQVYSGLNGGTLTVNTQTATQYNAIDKVTSIVVTDLAPQSGQTITSVTTTAQYDDVGGMTSLSDPDRGMHSYTYDPNGRLLTDVSGTRTIGTSYDLLGRAGCLQDAAPTTDGTGSCSSGSHPLVQNTYDTSVLGTAGSTDFPVQQLTQSVATTYYDPTDYTNKTIVTEQFQHDQRGHLITGTLQVGVPGGWGVTTALPTYQQTQAYNAIGQPTTTQTTVGGAAGSTSSQVYDSTTGQLTGLSNNSTTVANLATLGYNAQGLVSDVNFQTTTGTPLATDHFSFDSVLRPLSASATWQSGSGSTGTIFSTSRTYDAVGNVTSVNTTQGAVSRQSGSGGSEAQNFCYDEQNRLLWGGNGGTQPGAGNGTCGSATLANTLTGAGYTNGFAYTHLEQLWQGPLNGAGTAQQYLYCNSAHPHQLTGLYPTGTTCSALSGAMYSASYDAWGNLVSRSYGGATATLSYDVLDHLTQWNAGSTSQEWYAYDSSGNRVLRRSTTGSGTSITVYAFGSEEHVYDAMGNPTGNTYYYMLGGRLIGALSGTSTLTTQFFLTDALGSVLATFNVVAGSAVVLGNQVYGPYGTQRYVQGVMNTAKGFTGQYSDATGLDYYNARYYDPVVGVFVSADTVQGNSQGLDPYAYVGDNPETRNDPTGLRAVPDPEGCARCNVPPTPTPTPTPRPRPTPTKHSPPTDPCSKYFLCIKDPAGLAFGIAELGGAGIALSLGIGALRNPAVAWFSWLFKTLITQAGWAVVNIARNGAQAILHAFARPNPIVKLLVDITQVVIDVGIAFVSITDLVGAQRRVLQGYKGNNYAQKFRTLLDKAAKAEARGKTVYGSTTMLRATSIILDMASAAVSLSFAYNDILTVGDDIAALNGN